MAIPKNSPQMSETLLPGMSQMCETGIKSVSQVRKMAHKGGLVLRFGLRMSLWRDTEGISQIQMATKLADRCRKFGKDEQYLLKYIYRVETGRHEPAAWFVLLLQDVYGASFRFDDCLVRIRLEAHR